MADAAAGAAIVPAREGIMSTASVAAPVVSRKPRDDEINVWGLTHPGKVRKSNQDHFLLGSLHKRLEIVASSLPAAEQLRACDERLGFLAMIANGVGGRAAGEEASRLALEEVTQYVAQSTKCYYEYNSQADDFADMLQAAAIKSHERVLERAHEYPDMEGMATTLTLWIGVWPWIYLLQVGDSRYYLYHHGELTQVSRDQTVAEDLARQGLLTRASVARSPLANMLSSAIGGQQAEPVVTRLRSDWHYVHLLCSDGLTKHVSDERIAERLRGMTSARAVCEALLQDALDGGGTDNVTIIVGRAVRRDPA